MATDYRSQYEQKCADYDEMNLQFTEYQGTPPPIPT